MACDLRVWSRINDGIPLKGFRADDAVTLRFAAGDEPDRLPFGHTMGTARERHETFEVVLQPRDWLAYDVNVTHPKEYDFVLVGTSSDRPAVWVDGRAVDVSGYGPSGQSWQAEPIALGAGRHELCIGAATTELTLEELRVL